MAEDYIFRIKATNVGPINNLCKNFVLKSDKKRFCIYANNGSGKTIISKTISLVNMTEEKKLACYSHLITKKKDTFSFEFGFFKKTDPPKLLKISGNIFNTINTKNCTDYIFHVYNEEYIKDNIRAKKYAFDSKIDGYIIGDVAINLDFQKTNLLKLEENIEKIKENIELIIKEQLISLEAFNINKLTSEYKEINYDNIFNKQYTKINKSYEELKEEHNKLKSLPDMVEKLVEIDKIKLNFDLIDIQNLLKQEYNISAFSENFKQTITNKHNFIKEGVKISDGKECPFCGQSYNQQAINLINEYENFLNDKETQIISKIDEYILDIQKQEKEFNNQKVIIDNKLMLLEKYKNTFPSIKSEQIRGLNRIYDLKDNLNILSTLLFNKKNNLKQKINFEYANLYLLIKELNKDIEYNNELIFKTNNYLENSSSEKLLIKRGLCNNVKNETINKCAKLIDEYKNNINMINVSKSEIVKLESDSKILKKQIIAEELEFLLKYFFKDKYVFDKETFKISFMSIDVTHELDQILSDGEKNLIAFCYYIALTNVLVDKKGDFDNIFYIIDDPISSMDFQYVYSVAKIINDYCYKKTQSKSPVLILTHSLEFFSILLRNGLVDKGYCLNNGDIIPVSENIIVPYEQHLKDIYEISVNKKNVSHTTPNSMRYILETINKFKNPQLTVDEFIIDEKILNDSSPLIKIMHSFSHGEIRIELSYTDNEIIEGCRAIIDYIMNNYSGQINRIKSMQ